MNVKGQSCNRGAGGISWGSSTEAAKGQMKDLHRWGIPRTLQTNLLGKRQGGLQYHQWLRRRVLKPRILHFSFSWVMFWFPCWVYWLCTLCHFSFICLVPSFRDLSELYEFSLFKSAQGFTKAMPLRNTSGQCFRELMLLNIQETHQHDAFINMPMHKETFLKKTKSACKFWQKYHRKKITGYFNMWISMQKF